MPRFAAVIAAAGASSRFGGPVRKPFLTLDGKPVWLRAVELFHARPDVDRVALVLAPDDLDDFRHRHGGLLALVYPNVALVAGGRERFESVANALATLPDSIEFVAVHDAARALTPAPLIDAVFAAAVRHGAALLALPVADTLKRVEAGTPFVAETVPRADLWQAQTPQVARRDWLTAAYARRHTLAGPVTDDAQLLEAAGHRVAVVPGSPRNFKLTTAEDFALAEALLAPPRPEPPRSPFDDE